MRSPIILSLSILLALVTACVDDLRPAPMTCTLAPDDTDPDSVARVGCQADYDAVAAPPLVAAIPGASSVKTILDQQDGDRLHFQNSRRYPIHWNFASTHLSGNGLPLVPTLSQFNQTEYYAPDRRFLLGALNYYEGPGVWAYEIAPYDTASAEMILKAYRAIRANLFAGRELAFHPTSDTVAREADKLPSWVPVITTDELFAGIDYQPLNLGSTMGQLRFFTREELEDGVKYLSFRDVAVIDAVPNDLAVCSGTITAEFQTPLAHINVLAQNRGTPNMGLRGAFDDPALRALEGKWVELVVGPSTWTIREVTREEADAWWEDHRPPAVTVPQFDLTVQDLREIEDVLELPDLPLDEALEKAIPAFGGKASHYGGFPHITSFPIPYPKAVVVPIFFYRQFMEQNGFDARVEAMLADPDFRDDPAVREAMLGSLRDDMRAAPVDPAFEAALLETMQRVFPGRRLKFRSSTNCEDLGGFTGAGLYESFVADPNVPDRAYVDAARKVWSSVWRFRAFEEREYRSISHLEVGMAILINWAYPAEDANGVAITANIFDAQGVEPGYYINAQLGDVSVVLPDPGVTSDQFVYHYGMPGQPIVFLAHSNLVPQGQTVISRAQTEELGRALTAIHDFYSPVYGPLTPDHWYAMDVEWKFNTEPGETESKLVIKQARPYPGRGQ